MNKMRKNKSKDACLSMKNIHSAQMANKKAFCKSNNPADAQEDYANREKLIIKYTHLVRGVVSRLPITGLKDLEREDLVSYGIIGLIEAVDRYDPSRNVCFESYAVARIRGSIYDQLRANDFLSRGSRKKIKNLSKTVTKLEGELGRCPTDIEVSNEMEITLEELRSIKQESQVGVFSLDERKDSSDESCSLIESISSNDSLPQDVMEEAELIQALGKAIDCLPDRERTIVGLYHFNKLTFKEIAHVMEFSESRASQIHAKAILLLRDRMIKH